MQHIRLGGYVNLGAQRISALAQVSARTAQRWIQTGLAPAPVVALLRLRIDGDLGVIHPAWSGWRLRQGKLRRPDGYAELTPHNIHALPWLLQLHRELSRERDKQPTQHQQPERPGPWLRLVSSGG